MKTWFEFPEHTRFARSGRADILYTPIFFANEGISAKFCLDSQWSQLCDDYSQFEARVQLIGKASLGFLSIGGRPTSALDTRYALPSVGFKPIYTLTILELSRRVRLEEGSDDGAPFEFRLHTSTLADLQQIASSLKSVTADTASTMDVFKDVSPALIVSVQYALVGTLHYKGEKKSEHDSEIRLFVSLDESQVPIMTPAVIGNNPLASLSQTVYTHLGKTKTTTKGSRRRDSMPLIRRLSRSSSSASVPRTDSSVEEDSYLVVEVQNTEPFCFRTRDEASAARFKVTITYHSSSTTTTSTLSNMQGRDEQDDGDGDDDLPPPMITADATCLMKSLTSLTLEPAQPEGQDSNANLPDDFFHLRSKIFPLKKSRVIFEPWEKKSPTSAAATAAHDMMQTNNNTYPTTGIFNDYRMRRTSTLPNPSTIVEDAVSVNTSQGETQSSAQEAQPRTNPETPTNDNPNDTLPTTTTAPPIPPMLASPPPPLTIPTPPKRWTTSADLWLTHPITSTLTPSFTTPYINHLYTVSITMTLQPQTSSSSGSSSTIPPSPTKLKAFKTLKSSFNPTAKKSSTMEFTVPVSVRYDLGLVPSYEVDRTLPEYDFSLPGYDDAVGFNPGALESLERPTRATSSSPPPTTTTTTVEVNTDTSVELASEVREVNTRQGYGGRDVVEDVAAYEARVTGSRGANSAATAVAAPTSTSPTVVTSPESERHAWRFTNVDSSALVDDDDVLDMLMRDHRIGETPRVRRRVYGDGQNDDGHEN